MSRRTIRWLCRSLSKNQRECNYKWIAPKTDIIPKCPKCGGINVVKLEDYFEKAPLQ